MKRFTVLIASTLLLTAGCAGDDEDSDEQAAPPGRPAPQLVETTEVRGGSAEQRDLLRRIADGMEGTTLTRITLSPAEARRDVDGEKAVGIPAERCG